MDNQFAHRTYGDYQGMTLFGPPVDGCWVDRLEISSMYVDPLFESIDAAVSPVPKVVADWNRGDGWVNENRSLLSIEDAITLMKLLRSLSPDDLAMQEDRLVSDDCLRCAKLMADWIHSRVEDGSPIHIRKDWCSVLAGQIHGVC